MMIVPVSLKSHPEDRHESFAVIECCEVVIEQLINPETSISNSLKMCG